MSIQVRSNDPVIAKPEAAKAVEGKAEGAQASTLSGLEDKVPEQKSSEDSESTETEAKDAEKPADSEAQEDSESGDDGKEKTGKKKSGFQRRIDKLNARFAAKEQEAEFWRQQALKGANESKAQPKVDESKPGTADGKPKPDDFETHAEFVEALTDWKTEQKLNERDQKSQRQRLETDQERLVKSYADKREAFTKKAPDFDEVMESVDDIPLAPALREIILTSENGPEIAYELAKSREEYERISKLSPLALAREVGKIEFRISAKSSESKTEQKTITKAPKPIDPVNAGGKGSVKKLITDPNLSQREYEELRQEQMKRRRA